MITVSRTGYWSYLKYSVLQERKTLTWCEDDFSAGRLKLPGKDLKKCRFSGPVRSDQTVAVAFCKFDIYIFKQGFLPYAEGDITCTNHKNSPYSNRIIVSIFCITFIMVT